jgi:AAA+ superfamily predicted ATPase
MFERYQTDSPSLGRFLERSLHKILDRPEDTFIQGRRNLVIYGPVGTGKTHLAIAAVYGNIKIPKMINWISPKTVQNSPF